MKKRERVRTRVNGSRRRRSTHDASIVVAELDAEGKDDLASQHKTAEDQGAEAETKPAVHDEATEKGENKVGVAAENQQSGPRNVSKNESETWRVRVDRVEQVVHAVRVLIAAAEPCGQLALNGS